MFFSNRPKTASVCDGSRRCLGSEFQTVGKLAPSRPLAGGEGDRCSLLKNPVGLLRLNIKLFWPQWFNPSRFLPLPAN